MSYALETIANDFIRKARATGRNDLTPMKLLKLVYIANGWSLGLNNQPLYADEVEAWKFGPVVPALYHKVKRYRNHPIDAELPQRTRDVVSPEDQRLLDRIWDTYGQHDGLTLSSITHKPGTPWDQTWDDRGIHGLIIPPSKIREHYQHLAQG
ncbi:Panacea domain-containing protein [Salinicola halimionae]|uniref:Panacea domain-containing protein n=1 Tax=Salinicola halimionae TaxID=1949081 RepID=UPI001300689F|nr:type II toxin-antitoxin system antitoxin SocA domain-containing protein [Salinicola halimionae]